MGCLQSKAVSVVSEQHPKVATNNRSVDEGRRATPDTFLPLEDHGSSRSQGTSIGEGISSQSKRRSSETIRRSSQETAGTSSSRERKVVRVIPKGYSSGGSSPHETDSDDEADEWMPIEPPRSRCNSTDRLDLQELAKVIQEDEDLQSKLVRMETPYGTSIDEVYDGVHTGKILGSGVSGTVREITHRASGVKYAVKCLDLGLVRNEEAVAQLRDEIYIMCQLDHPNIVRLEEVYEGFSAIFLVLELCHGGDLFDRLDDQPDYHYTEAECARVVKQMLSSVRYLHSKHIIHRDLKLENFLFSSHEPNSPLKMIDFGLSKHFNPLTLETEVVGTPYTVAPEVIRGSYNERNDIWAVGVLTFLLLSGETPFGGANGENLLEVRNRILSGKVVFEPEEVWDHVSVQAKSFVLSLLKANPDERPTAKEAQKNEWIKTYANLSSDNSNNRKDKVNNNVLNPHVVRDLVSFKEFSDMRKLLCEVISFTLLPDQIESLRNEFEKIDRGRGFISLNDLKRVLLQSAEAGSLGALTEQEVEDIFDALRVRKDETKIRWHEFIAAGLSQCRIDERNLKLAFDRLDTSRSGYITFDNLLHLMGDSCHDVEDLKEMWVESLQLSVGSVDRITYDDFVVLMKGQAMGSSSSSSFSRQQSRRISQRHLDAVPEDMPSPTADREVGSGLDAPVLPPAETVESRAATARMDEHEVVGPSVYGRMRSKSLEGRKQDHFGAHPATTEKDGGSTPPSPVASSKRSSLAMGRSARAIEEILNDDSISALSVNKALYRAHREMRIAVLEASKRFEAEQAARRRKTRETSSSLSLSPSDEGSHSNSGNTSNRTSRLRTADLVVTPGLTLRRGSTFDSAPFNSLDDDEEKEIAQRLARMETASEKGGRTRQRHKVMSDLSGMM